jgi:hypothetical protein
MAGTTLFNLLSQQIASFFSQSAVKLGHQAAAEFHYQTILIDELSVHPYMLPALFKYNNNSENMANMTLRLVSLSFSGRFHGLNALAGKPDLIKTVEAGGGGVKKDVLDKSPSRRLLMLVENIYKELESLNEAFEELFFG